MNQPIIEVNNLTKVYRLGALGARSFAEETKAIFSKIIGKKFIPKDAIIDEQNSSEGRLKNENEFFALKDINFTVNKGEIVGIIGMNGAGKSTLLKILSRITEPTSGNAILRGRVGSLLEVGTGFHGDLTGKENTYLNGTILGMKRHEIDRKYEEIVTFAKLEKFMDTPVKRYSSGMFVRLAFAVAAHLEPEILIIDEVLAVGDAAFQDKCIGKMKNVSNRGKTILFVSHNMQLMRKLCPKCILLKDGKLIDYGRTQDIISQHLDTGNQSKLDEHTGINDKRVRRGNGFARISSFQVKSQDGSEKKEFSIGDTVAFHFECIICHQIKGLEIGITIRDEINKTPLLTCAHHVTKENLGIGHKRNIIIELDTDCIEPGVYDLYLFIRDSQKTNCDLIEGLVPNLILGCEKDKRYSGFLKDTSHLIKIN